MNGAMIDNVHIKVALSRRQPNMGDTHGHRRPGLGSRGKGIILHYGCAYHLVVVIVA